MVWPNGDAAAFFAIFQPLRPRLVYLDRDSGVVAVPIDGVIHLFDPHPEKRPGSRFGVVPDGAIRLRLSDDDDEDPLSADLLDLAARIAADPGFDGYDADDLIDESGLDVDPALYQEVTWEARRIFEKDTGGRLEKQARAIVRNVLAHPDFDPLEIGYRTTGELPYVRAALAGSDARLGRLVERSLEGAVWQQGLHDRAEREVQAEAARLLDVIPPLVLDQIGFASRTAARDTLLAPYLGHLSEQRRILAGQWIKRLDADRSHAAREQRYAAAAQRLWVPPRVTKKEIAARLQLSTSTFERLLALRTPPEFQFAADDPIVLDLAPELRN